MKILIIQLARLGDLFQTLPTIAALKRSDPSNEVHVLARKSFAMPLEQSMADRVWCLDSRDVLTPLIDEKPDLDSSLGKLTTLTEQLKAEGFDRVVNLSFSPFSSYVTKEIATPQTDVRGYTRFDDGYLSVPDDASAYFYAQVGFGAGRSYLSENANRVHVSDLFALVAGVELSASDWKIGVAKNKNESMSVRASGAQAIVVHVGASSLSKTLSAHKWLMVIKGLLEQTAGNVVLVGSKEERELADQAAYQSGARQVVNLVGETSISELVEIIRSAQLVIGGDSAPVQIASLTGTPVLNLSFPVVSFWETGPRSKDTRILTVTSEEAIASDEIVREAMLLLKNEPARISSVTSAGPTSAFQQLQPNENIFEWELLKAMYMGEAFPPAPHELFIHAIARLTETNTLAIEQTIELKRDPKNHVAVLILDRVDELMDQITQMVPEIGVLVRWFKTERIRLGPMSVEQIIEATESTHRRLGDILELYSQANGDLTHQQGAANDDIVLG